MRTSTVFSAIFFGLTAFAAPTQPGYPFRAVSNATSTMATRGSPTHTIFPNQQALWKEDAPDTSFGIVTHGEISAKDGQHRVSTAVNFFLPNNTTGLTCKLVFRLKSNRWDSIKWFGRRSSFDLYRIETCINGADTWNSHHRRTIKVATVSPRFDQDAEWERTTDLTTDTGSPKLSGAPTFSCVPGEYAFEMAPHGSDAGITWNQEQPNAASGLTIEVCGETVTDN